MTKLSEDLHTYDFINSVNNNKNGTDHISQEFLQSQMPSRLLHSKLNLKVGALIILLCNLYPTSGEYNGTRIVITRLGWRCIKAHILGRESMHNHHIQEKRVGVKYYINRQRALTNLLPTSQIVKCKALISNGKTSR